MPTLVSPERRGIAYRTRELRTCRCTLRSGDRIQPIIQKLYNSRAFAYGRSDDTCRAIAGLQQGIELEPEMQRPSTAAGRLPSHATAPSKL